MVQFYCLSIVMNIFAGLILIYGLDLTKTDRNRKGVPDVVEPKSEKVDGNSEPQAGVPAKKDKKEFKGLNGRSVRFLVGLLSVLVGFVKLFSPYGGIVILGDLLPSFAGLMGGASILLEFYTITTSAPDFELDDRLKSIFINSRKYIGVLCFISALLHFILPKIIIL